VATVVIQVGSPAVSRVSGADRFEVAGEVAKRTFPTGSSMVFVVSGENYPDALSTTPAATKYGALLLVRSSGVPDATRRQIERIRPAQITVVGGPTTVPQSVLDELAAIAGSDVTRISGVDRYEVSRQVARDIFGSSRHAFAATGAKFPDALSAGAAAAAKLEPIVLLDGASSTADAATQATFLSLSTSTITIVGGPSSVSTGVESSLRGIATVDRVAGADRYDASVQVAVKTVRSSATAYIATGLDFPDALVGGVLAGQGGAPLYLAPGNCVPTSVLADIARVGASEIVLLGGPASLSQRVFDLEHC
jgi:putative cell wall-binding protein